MLRGQIQKMITRYNTVQVIYLDVERLSGVKDTLIVHIQNKLAAALNLHTGDYISVSGEIRTLNIYDKQHKMKVLVYAYANNVDIITEEESKGDNNTLDITGALCKIRPLRTTPSGRMIVEGILAVEHLRHRFSYVPLIFWGNDAALIDKYKVGVSVSLQGRLQSRTYYSKKREQYETAYEVSVTYVNTPEEDKGNYTGEEDNE
jgi:single-stranded DNA-binding protein